MQTVLRLYLVLLILALALVAESSMLTSGGDVYWVGGGRLSSTASRSCNGVVGECIASDGNEMMMMDWENSSSRRSLAQGRASHISYAALMKDSVPCNKRGRSYYACRYSGKVNPYRRQCTMATHCARDLR
ncbi:protein RALF-like 19 [Telopea speciosissima]|uniref:protein RALF-like 19 n=1 Tax=Telopea speciosissima TaxID=54955 RepID=UPI001CC3DE63|nr:protein RALF-like 19 [Telopea speciosissima]